MGLHRPGGGRLRGFFGFLAGNTNDAGLMGFILGLIYGGALGFILNSFVPSRTAGRWVVIGLTAVLGFVLGKWGGAAAGSSSAP